MEPTSSPYRAVAVACLLAAGLAAAPAQWTAPPARLADHVVLISIDGLRPEFYLDPLWPAPMLQQMAREGAHAKAVRGVYPSVTYPSHTSIITGALPARHGIYYNSPFEPGGQTGRWYWEESAIRVPTLWDAVRAAGLRSANVGWPASVGAPVDWNIPEIWPLDRSGDPVEAIRRVAAPPGLLEEIEREATGRLTRDNFTVDYLARDDRAGAMAAYLLERYRPALLTLHLIETDHFQHDLGRDGPLVRRAVAMADAAVSQIVEAAERTGILQRTAFVVTGDHGMVDVHTQIAPNVWLVEAGLMEARADRGRWRATFHTAAASAFLHLRDPDDGAALEAVRELLAALPAGIRGLFRILEAEELARLGADPAVPLALAPVPGVSLTASTRGPAIRPADGATHGYLPDVPEIHTGFVGWGAGFRAGAVAPSLRLTDVGALVAELLGLELAAPEGLAPEGFLLRRPRGAPRQGKAGRDRPPLP